MQVTETKEGNAARMPFSLDEIPGERIFELSSWQESAGKIDSAKIQEGVFGQIGMLSFFGSDDDAGVKWEEYFEIK